MALVIRIDVDRPYGRRPLARHLLSRVSSDFYLPRLRGCGYLRELETLLDLLHERKAKAHAFFRRCTLPPPALIARMRSDGHVLGLHLENSRSFAAFASEKALLESHLGQRVLAFSKHGSGGQRYGWHHYAPYEPQNYTAWASQAGMTAFLGNLEDPSLPSYTDKTGLFVFPSAFWLEPDWRDTTAFPVSWLLSEARHRDVVLLIHPENVLASPTLTGELDRLLCALDTKVLES